MISSIKIESAQLLEHPILTDIASRFGFSLTTELSLPFQLAWLDEKLQLMQTDTPAQGGVSVDFNSPQSDYRRSQISIKKEAIAKAVGAKANHRPSVLDATAGLGRDGFVLAALGCKVTLLERNPVVAALLYDGLRRAKASASLSGWIEDRLEFIHCSSLDLAQVESLVTSAPEVVYLDPMYPHKKKSASVKKEMKVFQSVVGADLDADGLLENALKLATQRVVVKRPDYAEPLAGVKPSFVISSKKNRFDIYARTV